jgi:transposase IS200 family protein/VCBS repeat protein
VARGDYDNDGDLDILLTGYSGSGDVAKVYRNDGGGVFTDTQAGLTGVYQSSAVWGDYDGNLDILLTGLDNSTPTVTAVSKVFRHDTATANTLPGAPSGLGASVDGNLGHPELDSGERRRNPACRSDLQPAHGNEPRRGRRRVTDGGRQWRAANPDSRQRAARHGGAHTVGFLKGKSAIRIHREFLGRERSFTGVHLWARGYCVSTVGLDEGLIREYIRNRFNRRSS